MLSVLTLNLRFGLADDGPNGWQYRRKIFTTLLAKYHVDFIGFQEANDFQLDDLDNILTEYDFIGKRSPSPFFWQNNIIFYSKTWSCIHQEHFFLSPTPMIPSRFRKSLWPRQCTIGMFAKNRRRLICANTHFDFDVSVQIESAKLIMERLSHLPPDVPVILMGDFNAPPSSPCYTIFTGKNQKSADLKRFFKNVFKKPFPGTHHGFTGNANGDHIDWILYRGRIAKKKYKVIRDIIDGIYPSDHFPLYASFNWLKLGKKRISAKQNMPNIKA
ncbi:MAG: endonuclease/exonuclease/phosphatase family protein [Desulfobacterales bacterium]|nr:endonuclease/exonuclease/phosphatase family protein [Desulfobacterales bacterium]